MSRAEHGGDIYAYSEKILDFSVNINPFGMPEKVKEVMISQIDCAMLYPDRAYRKLYEVMEMKLQIPKEHILLGNGAAELFYSIVQMSKPKKAICFAPDFAEYETALRTQETEVLFYELAWEEKFRITEDFLLFLEKHNDVDMMFLARPQNPTGYFIDDDMFEKLLLKASELHIQLVVDECFLELSDMGDEKSLLRDQAYLKWENVLVVRALTKTYAIPGLRIGYLVSSNVSLLEKMERNRQAWPISSIAQVAATEAFSCEDYVEKARKMISEQKRFLYQEFAKRKIEFIESSANFILFQGNNDWKEKFLQKGILIRDCSSFRGLGKGTFRIAVRQEEENVLLIKALDEIREIT